MSGILGLLTILFIVFAPFYICAEIAEKRNRNQNKAMFLAFFFSWFAVVGLWLALKTRSKETGMLM